MLETIKKIQEKILAYHGTSTLIAMDIAKTGAILSPWDHQILFLDLAISENPDRLEGLLIHYNVSSRDKEELALKMASETYSHYEIESRVKCVQLVKTPSAALNQSKQYTHNKGIVLALEVPKEYDAHHTNIFIPRKIGLESLKSITALAVLSSKEISELATAYSKYDTPISNTKKA
jgi:hypothetical protein